MAVTSRVEQENLEPRKIRCCDVEHILTHTLYHYTRWLVVPNVSWGMMSWECDLLALSGSGYFHEIEIKVCPYDLKADAKKSKWVGLSKWKYRNTLREFWYAAPKSVWDKAGYDCVPPDVGIIEINPDETHMSRMAVKIRGCKPNKQAIKATDKQRMQLGRLGTMRYWTTRHSKSAS